MNVATPCLTEQQIDELRLDQLSREEMCRIEEHVGECPRCQSLLDNSAADAHEWGDLRESLTQKTVIDDASTSLFESEEEASASSSLDQILKMLGPTDDPRMLGRIGPYEIVGILGQGGMGIVFKGYESSLNRFVAIKLLLPHLATTGAARKRFAREAQAAAAVVDEHVMAIHGVAEWQGIPYLVMPFTRGVTLQKRLIEQGPFELREILRIGMQAAAGLAAAHAQGLVHRDVKPANMLLAQGVERVTLVDFGLARTMDDASITRTGFLAGTPQYMSPEQARSEPVDARSDLFSLGSVIYAICTGRAPFRAETSYGVLRLITDSEPTPIRELNPDVPEWLCRIVERLMAKRPGERFSSASEVSKLFSGCLAHVQNPDASPLPMEAIALLPREAASRQHISFFRKDRPPMTRILVSLVGVVGVIMAFCFQGGTTNEQLASLQGEWKLIALEREGKAKSPDEFFNERLIIDKGSFSQLQTAPDGAEIEGESGRVSIPESQASAGIDFKMWEGTAHGIYELKGDELVLCVTREGGPRPDSLKTSAGDLRVLKTYRRMRKPSPRDPKAGEENTDRLTVNDLKHTWTSAWIEKVSAEVPDSVNREGAQQWLREHEFREIETGEITLTLMKKIHPGVDQQSIERDGIRYYVRGVLRSNSAEDSGAAVEAYYLFSEAEKLLALHVGPFVSDSLNQPIGAATGAVDALGTIAPSRNRLPITRPVMAESAPIIACIGPEQPLKLGEMVSLTDINQGLDPNVVRLHVWDCNVSDMSRVLLIQRSELGALSPDGKVMLTQEGEMIDLSDKRTRQFSGFTSPVGQPVTAMHLSKTREYAAAIVHLRTDLTNLPTDPPTVDSRHFWGMRLLQLDSSTHQGHRIGEYPADARPGVVFSTDESSAIYSTDQHAIVRRELPTGKILMTYDPPLGVDGAVGLAMSADGRLVAASGYHGKLLLWEVETGALRLQRDAVRSDGERDTFFRASVLRFSPDGSKLAMVSGNHVKVMDVNTGNILREHRDPTRPNYVRAHWSADAAIITLLTSSQPSVYGDSWYGSTTPLMSNRRADRLPTVYEWKWETGEPVLRQYPTSDAAPAARIDPDMEARRFTGTWRVVSRSTAGIEQKADMGQTVQIRHRRMGEVLLDLDPNQHPRTVDIVYCDGPDKGKVLKGIYEWNPKKVKPATGARDVLRICTFIEPHPDRPNARPTGFEAGSEVDTAIWECLSRELPASVPPDNPAAKERSSGERERVVPVDSDSPPATKPRPTGGKQEDVHPS
ncbi:MAG: protein kinase [Pirellulales bacterium]